MMTRLLLPALTATAILAACSAPDANGPDNPHIAVETGFSNDNLAFSDACFADDRSGNLVWGQSLVERTPDGIVRVSYALDDRRGDHEFTITSLDDEQRQAVDAAAADFIRTAGLAHDPATDAVIYHRETDGSFCTVVKDVESGRVVRDAAIDIESGLYAQ